jgi:two-component system chemotaxis sensor kinase CheA
VSQVDAIVREFVAESYENLAQLEVDLVGLEREPGSRDLVASIFRTIHTVKGTCGFLGLPRLEELAHAGENLLSRWRDGALDTTRAEPVDLLLRMVDVLRVLLASIEATGSDDVEAEAVAAVVADIDGFLARSAQAQDEAGVETDTEVEARSPEAVVPTDEPDEPARTSTAPVASAGAPRADDSVRVATDVLDALVRQVGELVLARNRLARLAADRRDPELLAATAAVRSVVGELQASVMKTRMQPVSHAWQGLPRLVRDLSAQLGKSLELDTSGGEVELDRALIDTLRDPLTHLVRNAADHGIETASQRRAAGKPEVGRITLRAHRQGGALVIEVADDGRGVDLARVRERAVATGLLTPEAAASRSDDELAELVFQAGFSTASAVSHVSGRGVGMDVVRSAVESVRGTVRLSTAPGEGTTCRLALPVTLAVTPSVTVEVGGQRFAIPHSDLRELVRVDGTATVMRTSRVRPCCACASSSCRSSCWASSSACGAPTSVGSGRSRCSLSATARSGCWWTPCSTPRRCWSSRSTSGCAT